MTPLVRSVMKDVAESGQDPTEMHWFDSTGCFADKTEYSQDPLITMRPPFETCVVCWSGTATDGRRMEAHMLTAGNNPEEGVAIAMWRNVAGTKVKPLPTIIYTVSGGQVTYGLADDKETISDKDAQMVLGFMSAWLGSMSRRAESYVPSVAPTFTNRRKIAEGKIPTYDWRTVVIEPVQVRREHQGGTHASPRLHDRRGHMRRLRSGKSVWVKACKVGDASKGTVFHDYELRREE